MSVPTASVAGRRRRVLVLILAVAAYLLSFFHRVAPAAIANDLAASFQTSATQLGLLAATYFYVYTLMQIPTGVLADTLGPRRILTLGGGVAGGGSLVFALAPDFEIALVGRTLVGLGVSVAFIAMLKLIAVWCEESRFASILGLAMLIGNVGSVLAGAPLAWAAQASSWRVVFAVIALLSLGIAIASWYRVVDSPHGDSRHRIDRGAWLAGLASVVRNPATWPGFFVNFGIGGSFFAFAGLWAVPYLTQVHGMTRTVAANHVSLYFLAFAIGCLFVGSLSDRIGRRKPVMLLGSTLYCASWLSWLSGADLSGVGSYSVCAAMGLFTASLTLSWACAKEVNSPLLSGMATSVVNVGVFLGAAVFQPLVGWAMDRGWDGALIEGARAYSPAAYRTGLVLMMGAAFFGALATLFVRETRCRNIWREANGSPR